MGQLAQGSGVGRQQCGLQHAAALSLLVTVRAVLHLGPEMDRIGAKKTEMNGKHMFRGPESLLRDRDTLVLVPGLPAMRPLGLSYLLYDAAPLPHLGTSMNLGALPQCRCKAPSVVLGLLLNSSPDSVLGTEHPQMEAFKPHSGIHCYCLFGYRMLQNKSPQSPESNNDKSSCMTAHGFVWVRKPGATWPRDSALCFLMSCTVRCQLGSQSLGAALGLNS